MVEMKIGDIVALVTFGDGTKAVKIIGETKKYFRVDLKHLPKSHMARFTFECNRDPEEIILDSQLYSKTTGLERGAVNWQYCPNYITNLEGRIQSLKRHYESSKDYECLEEFNKELLTEIEALEKAQKEGVPA